MTLQSPSKRHQSAGTLGNVMDKKPYTESRQTVFVCLRSSRGVSVSPGGQSARRKRLSTRSWNLWDRIEIRRITMMPEDDGAPLRLRVSSGQ